MKTALLHYWMINNRGGEKVLSALGEMLPEADIYTHAFGEKMREDWGGNWWHGHKVHETFIAGLPRGRKHPQMYLPLMPMAQRSMNLDGYDLIVSSESGPIKDIKKPKGARHICYCHTPMRYLWDMKDEYFRTADWKGKLGMTVFLKYLQRRDKKSADAVDTFVANSMFVAERIKRIYGRDSTVVYPPVDVEYYANEKCKTENGDLSKDYYLVAGQLTSYKKPDLAVEACHRLGRRLIVTGDGDMLNGFRKLNYPGVKVVGRVTDELLRKLYTNAKALIFPGVEDFGIVPIEAQAAGTPVIAIGKGGALETVVDGETGLFFKEQTVESLCAAIEEFEGGTLLDSAEACRANAARFTKERFVDEMTKIIYHYASA